MKDSQRQRDLIQLEAAWHLSGLDDGIDSLRSQTMVISTQTYQLGVEVIAHTARLVDAATGRPVVDSADAAQFLDQAQQVTRQVQDSLEPGLSQSEPD